VPCPIVGTAGLRAVRQRGNIASRNNMATTNAAEERYRTLLDVSCAVADQPTIKAILQSLRGILSGVCSFNGAELYVLADDGGSLHVFDFDRAADAPPIKAGTKILRIGAAAQVLEEQKPVFLPDASQEMLKHPELAPFAPAAVGHSTYLFPVSTSQQRYGILAVTKLPGQGFLPDDVELLRSLASHVAVALESALARDRAELYQRQVTKERDRLKLLLEINSHVVTKLDILELFRSASTSIRSYFQNDFTGFWLIGKDSNQLELAVLDFPGSRGFLTDVAVTIGCRRPKSFGQEDLDLLVGKHLLVITGVTPKAPVAVVSGASAIDVIDSAFRLPAMGAGSFSISASDHSSGLWASIFS
jgi:hypothetical protein